MGGVIGVVGVVGDVGLGCLVFYSVAFHTSVGRHSLQLQQLSAHKNPYEVVPAVHQTHITPKLLFA